MFMFHFEDDIDIDASDYKVAYSEGEHAFSYNSNSIHSGEVYIEMHV